MPRLSRFFFLPLCVSLLATAGPDATWAYTVQAGDSPYSIAKKHNISLEELIKANKGLKSGKIQIGETLTIPGGGSGKSDKKDTAKEPKKDKAEKKAEKTSSKDKAEKKEETHAGKDKADKTSSKERAAEARDHKQEKETKPTASKGSGHYVIKKGDTLGSIAGKYDVSVDTLLKANKGLKASRIKIGQEIAIPGSGPAAKPESAAKPEPAAKPEKAEKTSSKSRKAAEAEEPTTTYTARHRDTVHSVARKFHISPEELARLNPHLGKKLHKGQKLTVPAAKGNVSAPEEEAAGAPERQPARTPAPAEETMAEPERPAKATPAPTPTPTPATPSLPENKDTAEAEAAFEKGIEFGKQNKFQKAVESFDKAVKLNPNRADYFASRGHANYYLKQYSKAIDDYTKAIEKNPSFALAYSMRGLSRTRSGHYPQAIDDFNKAISFGPNEADYYKGRGFTYLLLKQYGPMCQDYQKACSLGDCELLDSAKKEKRCQ